MTALVLIPVFCLLLAAPLEFLMVEVFKAESLVLREGARSCLHIVFI